MDYLNLLLCIYGPKVTALNVFYHFNIDTLYNEMCRGPIACTLKWLNLLAPFRPWDFAILKFMTENLYQNVWIFWFTLMFSPYSSILVRQN